jgi:hypothetical protein
MSVFGAQVFELDLDAEMFYIGPVYQYTGFKQV